MRSTRHQRSTAASLRPWTTDARPPRVAIVDDSLELLAVIGEMLRAVGAYDVRLFSSESTTLDDLAAAAPDLMIIDLRLGAGDAGWQLLQASRIDPLLATVPAILCSGDVVQLRRRAAEIANLRWVAVLEKPFSLEAIEALLTAGLAASRLAASRIEPATTPGRLAQALNGKPPPDEIAAGT